MYLNACVMSVGHQRGVCDQEGFLAAVQGSVAAAEEQQPLRAWLLVLWFDKLVA